MLDRTTDQRVDIASQPYIVDEQILIEVCGF